MLDIKPLIVVDVSSVIVLDPLFVGGYHVIVYELAGFKKRNVTDEFVDDIFAGGFAFPGTATQSC